MGQHACLTRTSQSVRNLPAPESSILTTVPSATHATSSVPVAPIAMPEEHSKPSTSTRAPSNLSEYAFRFVISTAEIAVSSGSVTVHQGFVAAPVYVHELLLW